MKVYPRELIARIKGALRAGLKPKQIAYRTGIPAETIKEWSSGDLRDDVAADETVGEDITAAILGRFMGSSTR